MQKLFLILLFVFPASSIAQFLLDNPDFNNDLSGWDVTSSPPAVWNNLDFDGSFFSGSVFLTNSETTSNSDVEALTQCLSISPDGNLVYGLSALIPSGQATSGSVVMRFYSYNSSDCTGFPSSETGHFVMQSNIVDTWQSNIQNTNIQILDNSAKFTIAIRKTEDNGSFTAFADVAILLNIDHIFSNSFE